MAKFLRVVGLVWCYAVAASIVVAVIGTIWLNGLWQGYQNITYWFSPFNVANFLVTAVIISPGLACLLLSEKISARRDLRN